MLNHKVDCAGLKNVINNDYHLFITEYHTAFEL